MSRVFQCDRCKKIYEKNHNNLLEEVNKPVFPSLADDWSIAYIQFSNTRLDIETLRFNLCDECVTKLCDWMFKGKSL